MKILFVAVNAKYSHMNPALYSIRAFQGENARFIDIAEYTINQFSRDVLRDIFLKSPEVIGFSVYIWNADFIGKLLRDLKKILPDTKVFLGGPEAGYRKADFFKRFPVDGVFFGEGERAWKAVIERLVSGKTDLSDIPGLYIGKAPVFGTTPLSMNDLPFIYNEDNIGLFENRMLYYESSRGCPYHCSYCLSSREEGLRFRSLDKVYPELDFFLAHKVRLVKFIDRTFNADDRRALSIWRYIAAHDNGVTRFHFEIEADILSDEALEFLKTVRKGLFQLEIGVQSTDERVLREIKRYAKTDRIRKVVRTLAKSAAVMQHVDLIAGLPGENIAGFIRSFNEVYSWGADELQLGFLKVLPGTEMAERAEDYGLVYETEAPYEILKNRWLSYEDITTLKNVEEMLERYGNSGMFQASLPAFLRLFDTPFNMYLFLADYYRAHTVSFEKQSRISAYRMLREAYGEASGDTEHVRHFDALLMKDLYRREKLKARPGFSGDEEGRRKAEKAFVINRGIRENVHIEFTDFDPERFEADGTVIPGFFATVFAYDGQGGAVSIRTETISKEEAERIGLL